MGDKRCYDVLRESKELYLDGTYKVTPLNLYKQLYTIHCKANGVIFPVIYALMKYKKNESYEKLFNIVEHEVGKPIFHEPKTVLGDFEIVNIHCFSKDVVKKACFFHYTQNIYRRAQKIGAVEYGKRGSFHSLCKSLMVLPLILDFGFRSKNAPNKIPKNLNSTEQFSENFEIHRKIFRKT